MRKVYSKSQIQHTLSAHQREIKIQIYSDLTGSLKSVVNFDTAD